MDTFLQGSNNLLEYMLVFFFLWMNPEAWEVAPPCPSHFLYIAFSNSSFGAEILNIKLNTQPG